MWTPTYRKFKQTLMAMCRMTSPHGCEPYVWAHLPSPPHGGAPGSKPSYEFGSTQIDRHGNYIIRIPGAGERIMWTAHCDTADSEPKLVNMKWHNDMLMTDGRSILGADDKVGCTIMTMMIRAGCPGTYVFFQGEEVGCIGSGKMADETPMLDYDACISLDRRGYDSVITHQRGSRACSDAWAQQLATVIHDESNGEIALKCDPTGVFTDSAEFTDLIPECTNLSVGYFSQHTHSEKTDVAFSYSLCCALIKVANKGLISLPVRDIVNKIDDDDDDLDWYRSYRMRAGKYDYTNPKTGITDPDFLSDNDWRDWRDSL
jgi:hypothetical protein